MGQCLLEALPSRNKPKVAELKRVRGDAYSKLFLGQVCKKWKDKSDFNQEKENL